MKLSEWIDGCTGVADLSPLIYRRTAGSRTELYRWLADETGVSVQTISSVDRGMKLKTYARAKAISDATHGAVTVEDLCE